MNPITFIHRDKKKNLKYLHKWTLQKEYHTDPLTDFIFRI